MGENNDDNDKQKPPVHNPNNKKRVKPPPPSLPPPLTRVLGELENNVTNANDPISLFLAELKKQDKAARLENPTKAIQDAYQQMLNNGHKRQDFYPQIRHLVIEGVSVREAVKQKVADEVSKGFKGSYKAPPPPPPGVVPFNEAASPQPAAPVKPVSVGASTSSAVPAASPQPKAAKSTPPADNAQSAPPPPPVGAKLQNPSPANTVLPAASPLPGSNPVAAAPAPPPVPPANAKLPPPFDPSQHAGLSSDVLKAAAKRIEQIFSQAHFARHSSHIAVKINIQKTADDSYKVTATFPGRDKPAQSTMYSSSELINYANAQKNNVPLPVFQSEQVAIDANMKRAIEIARTPIAIPREIQKFSKTLDKNVQKYIEANMKDSAKVEALYKKHFDQSKPVKNVIAELEKNPVLKAQFKYLLTMEHLVVQQKFSEKDPTNQAAILKYLGEKLTQAGALLKGTGYEPPQKTSRPTAIAHNHNLQRNRSNTLDPLAKPQTPVVTNDISSSKPRPGGSRSED